MKDFGSESCFSSYLLAFRTKHKLQVKETAAVFDLDARTYHRWERGETVPARVTIEGCVARVKAYDYAVYNSPK